MPLSVRGARSGRALGPRIARQKGDLAAAAPHDALRIPSASSVKRNDRPLAHCRVDRVADGPGGIRVLHRASAGVDRLAVETLRDGPCQKRRDDGFCANAAVVPKRLSRIAIASG